MSTAEMNEAITEVRCKRGRQIFGSGGYSAGWKVIEGQVTATPIAGSEYSNGFVYGCEYLLRPKTDVAVVKVTNGDCISSSGWRSLGKEGLIVLRRDDSVPEPK